MPKCENCENIQEQLNNITEEYEEFKEMSQEYEEELEKNLIEYKKDVENAQYKSLKFESENKELKDQLKVLKKEIQQKDKHHQDQIKKSDQKNKKNQKKLINLEIESEEVFEKFRRLQDEFQIVNQKKQYLEEQLTIYKIELQSIKNKYDYDVTKINQELQEAKEDLFIQQQKISRKKPVENILNLNCKDTINVYTNQQKIQNSNQKTHKKSLSMVNSLVCKSKNQSRKRLQLKHTGLKYNQNLLNKIRFNLRKRSSQNEQRMKSSMTSNSKVNRVGQSVRFININEQEDFKKQYSNKRQNTNIYQLILYMKSDRSLNLKDSFDNLNNHPLAKSLTSISSEEDEEFSLARSRLKQSMKINTSFKKKKGSVLTKRTDIKFIKNRISQENFEQYLKYIQNKQVKNILGKQQDLTQSNLETFFQSTDDKKLKVKNYLVIFIFLSSLFQHQKDFANLFYFYAPFYNQNKRIPQMKKVLNDREFLKDLIVAIFDTKEYYVYDLLLNKFKNLEILFKKDIMKVFLDFNEIENMKRFIQHQNLQYSQRDVNINKNMDLIYNLGKIIQLFIDENKKNLIKHFFGKLEIKPNLVFQKMIKISKSKYLIVYNEIFPIVFTQKDFDLLVDFKRYGFILQMEKISLLELVTKEHRFKKMMNHFERLIAVNEIPLIIYKIRNRISSRRLVEIFYDKIKFLLEQNYQTSPIFFSKNPLKFCYVFHIILDTFNKKLRLIDEDLSRLSEDFQQMCLNVIEFLPQNVLEKYVFYEDYLGKIFLDYLFKGNATDVAKTRFIRNSIESYWNLRVSFKKELIYYSNCDKIYKLYLQNNKKLKKLIKMDKKRSTYSQLKFSIFQKSLKFRIYIQIIETTLFVIIEFFQVFCTDIMIQDSINPQRNFLVEFFNFYPTLCLFIIIFRITYIVNVSIKILLHKNSMELEGLNSIHLLLIISVIFQQLILFSQTIGQIQDHKFWYINLNNFILYLLVGKIFSLFLPIPEIGKVLRIFIQMIKIVVWFTFLSFFAFIFVAFVINRLFLEYKSDFNIFDDIYIGLLTLYEFAFGAVLYDKVKIGLGNFFLNAILILFSFFGNVMLVNILIAYLTNRFNEINSEALYLTLRSQYNFYKIYPKFDRDFIYYSPFFFNPILILFTKKKNNQKFNKQIKILSHIFYVVIPLIICLPFINMYAIIKYYLQGFDEIFFNLRKKKFIKFFSWLILGPFILTLLALIDNYNVLQVVTDYSIVQKVDDEFLELDQKWKFLKQVQQTMKTMKLTQSDQIQKYDYKKLFLELLQVLNQEKSQSSQSQNSEQIEEKKDRKEKEDSENKFQIFKEFITGFTQQKQFVNIEFLQKYLNQNLRRENLDLIINYELEELKNAQFATIFEEEADIKINIVNKKI